MRERYLDGPDAAQVLASIARDLEGTRAASPLPDLGRAALLLLDLQRIFVDPDSPAFLPAWHGAGPRALEMERAFREAGRPIVRTRHVHPGDDPGGTIRRLFGRLLTADDPLSALAGGWTPGEGDIVLEKPRHSAFARTDLAARLAAMDVDVVVLAGVQAHLCVLATAVEAGSHDLLPVVALDAVAAPDRALHRESLRALSGGLCWISTADEIVRAVRG
jgi:isochorismate hydrolase